MSYEYLRTSADLPRLFRRPDALHDPLVVLTTIFNPARYRSRYKLYQNFELHMLQSGVLLYTVEIALGNRDFAITESGNPYHLQLRTNDEMWFKENSLDVLAQYVLQREPNARWLAYIDADFHFVRPDWADETRQMLEHYPIVQMWSHLQNLDFDHSVRSSLRSFVSLWKEYGEIPVPQAIKLPYSYDRWGAPGGAWAMHREVWDALGGLIDFCILGSADYWMALALTGQACKIVKRARDVGHGITTAQKPLIMGWQHRAEEGQWRGRPIIENVGLVQGTAVHYWHGSHADRQYDTRGNILPKYGFDPALDLRYGVNGLLQFTNRQPGLRREVQAYLHSRNEDA